MREDWVETYLPNVCDILDNLRKPINSSERKKRIAGKSESELYPYYGATGQVGYIDDYLTDGEFVLIGEDGAPFLDYTRDVAYKINGKTWVNNHAHILKSFFNNDYLLHYLNQFQFRDFVTGTTRLKLTQGALKRMPVKLPPLPIQRAIVHKIENLIASLDKGIADLKKAQEQLKVYRQAVLKKAFEGEMTKEWREKHVKTDGRPSQEKTTKAIAAEPEPEYKQTNHSKNKLPEEWKFMKLVELTELNPKPNKDEIDSNIEVQFLPMKLVEEVNNKIHLAELRRFSEVQKKSYTYFEEGDVLFAKVTPCMENGKIAIARNLKNGIGYGSSEFHIFRCKDNFSNEYLFYFLVQEKFRSNAQHAMTGAVGLRRVPKYFLENYDIPITSLEEQDQIVREIESRLSVCDKVEQNITEGLEKSEALRQSILKKAFEGKLLSEAEIEQCKQEADYEPASVLLEKIKKIN